MRVQWNRRQFLKSAAISAAPLLCPSLGNRLAFSALETTAASRWVSFRNSQENMGLAEKLDPSKLIQKWTFPTKDGTSSTPVIADGLAYIGTLAGSLHCLQLSDGTEKWKAVSAEDVAPNSFPPGFNAPAALNDELVFIGDDQGTFHAFDRQTGKTRWKAETDGEIVGGAQLHQGRVIFGSHDGHLYCHDAASGDRVWSAETHGPVNATPCLTGQFTFTTGCDQPILRVIDLENGRQAAEVPLNSLLIAACAVRDDILYFGTDNGTITALDWKQKKIVWEYSSPGKEQQIHSSPAVTADRIVVGSRDKRVYCLDRQSGKPVWTFTTRAKIDSSPVIAGDTVYFGCSDKQFYGVSMADGTEVFKKFVKNPVTGSPAIAQGYLVFGCDATNGQIFCFADPDAAR